MYCLDTNICIYALKGMYESIRSRLEEVGPAAVAVPAIVKAELLYGAAKSDRPRKSRTAIEEFLSPFDVLPFGDDASEHYARVRAALEREGTPIGPSDLVIAATTLSANRILVSHNLREFSRVKGLRVEDWT